MNWLKKLFKKKEKQTQSNGLGMSLTNEAYDYQNDLLNPTNPISPLNLFSVWDTGSDYSSSSHHDSSSSSHDTGSSWGSDSSSYDSGSSYSDSTSTGGDW